MKKFRNRKLTFGLVVLAALAATLLWLPNYPVDGNTPEWLAETVTRTTAFVAAFNHVTIIVVGLVALVVLYFIRNTKTRQNADALKLLSIAGILYGAYLLLMPALAASFSDQQWLVDFSSHANEVN